MVAVFGMDVIISNRASSIMEHFLPEVAQQMEGRPSHTEVIPACAM